MSEGDTGTALLATTDRRPIGGRTAAIIQAGDITAGRDVNFGPTPEEMQQLTEAAARGATKALTSAITDLSKRLEITENATKTLLRNVGERKVPLELLSKTLDCVVNDYKRLQGQVAALNPDNETARDLATQAEAAITAGQLERAHQLLREAAPGAAGCGAGSAKDA